MTTVQFVVLLLAVVVASGVSVAIGFFVAWRRLERMFDRALNHGGSIDTASRVAKARAEESVELATKAVDATRALKDRVVKVEGRLSKIEECAIFRPIGGTGEMGGVG